MGRLFGTDGVRGVANTELSCQTAYRLGQAAAAFLGPIVAIGKDTRRSGDMLEAACAAGVMSAGGTALSLGVIPTPAVALLVRELGADGGIVISASHNPPEYNGIKLFDRDGFKLDDAAEDEVAALVEAGGLEACAASEAAGAHELPAGDAVGVTVPIEDAQTRYIDHAVRSVRAQGVDFAGLSIAVDAGHGAASLTTPAALRKLGAEVTVINDDYDGLDINVGCGSTHLEPLTRLMRESGAVVGLAHDGDADRVMLMAPDGTVIDGDFVEAVIALDMKERGMLADDAVVTTIMCNLGFTKAMETHGVTVVQTKVGDRYVLEQMRARGLNVGGEQSGHTILLDYNSTGDGLMTACQFLAALVRSGKPLSELVGVMRRFPQALVNVRVRDKEALAGNEAIARAVRAVEERLADAGRVVIRPSGTEPVVRVMVEAESSESAQAAAERIARVVKDELA